MLSLRYSDPLLYQAQLTGLATSPYSDKLSKLLGPSDKQAAAAVTDPVLHRKLLYNQQQSPLMSSAIARTRVLMPPSRLVASPPVYNAAKFTVSVCIPLPHAEFQAANTSIFDDDGDVFLRDTSTTINSPRNVKKLVLQPSVSGADFENNMQRFSVAPVHVAAGRQQQLEYSIVTAAIVVGQPARIDEGTAATVQLVLREHDRMRHDGRFKCGRQRINVGDRGAIAIGQGIYDDHRVE